MLFWLTSLREFYIESASNNVERRKSSHKSHIMAPFGSSLFGSHLNLIATSTSGGIVHTMSLVFILRIILGIILIVRRSAVGRKVFFGTRPIQVSRLAYKPNETEYQHQPNSVLYRLGHLVRSCRLLRSEQLD